MSNLLNDVIPLVRTLADRRRIQLDRMSSSQRIKEHVLTDEKLLRQVMLNLLPNAIKYNCDGGQVRVACETQPSAKNYLSVVVSDTGPGWRGRNWDDFLCPLIVWMPSNPVSTAANWDWEPLEIALSLQMLRDCRAKQGASTPLRTAGVF